MPDLSTAPQHSRSPLRFTRLYSATLVGLAVLLTVTEIITQWQIDKFHDELTLIRHAGIQRRQCQHIVKKAVQLTAITNPVLFRASQREVGQLLNQLEQNHQRGRDGILTDSARQVPLLGAAGNQDVQVRYREVQPLFEAMQTSIRRLLTSQDPAAMTTPAARANLAQMLANETYFLEKIDTIVRQYTTELRAKLYRLQQIELLLHVLTLFTLFVIAWFVYRPAARRLRDTIDRLVAAEQRTTDVNRKLTTANSALKKARQQLFDATKLQFQQQINEQKTRTAYLMAGQEEERKRLSRELHDGLGQMLTAIKLQVEGLEGKLVAGNVTNVNLGALKILITQTIQETRSISNNLMPSALSDFGLLSGLRTLVNTHHRPDATTNRLQVLLHTDAQLAKEDHRLDKNIEITLYRVTQEAITNAIRHGKATKIKINLFEKEQSVYLTVIDNGVGFKTRQLTTIPQGQGVHNIHERIKLLNGAFKLTSTPGKGTQLTVSIPYNPQKTTHDYDQLNVS